MQKYIWRPKIPEDSLQNHTLLPHTTRDISEVWQHYFKGDGLRGQRLGLGSDPSALLSVLKITNYFAADAGRSGKFGKHCQQDSAQRPKPGFGLGSNGLLVLVCRPLEYIIYLHFTFITVV